MVNTLNPNPTPNPRRRALHLASAAAAWIAMPAFPALGAPRAAAMPTMTDGPFYPPRAWRERVTDWDADLTRVMRGGQMLVAQGEHLALDLTVADTEGRRIDGAEVEIWQCDTRAAYRHPGVNVAAAEMDAGFQGFGAARSGADGSARFRTIRPVAYPGRTPHIHVKVRHASFGTWTSQLFLAGDPGNARDFLWRQLGADGQAALAMQLLPASASVSASPASPAAPASPADSGLRWQVQHALVLPLK